MPCKLKDHPIVNKSRWDNAIDWLVTLKDLKGPPGINESVRNVPSGIRQ